MKIKIKEWPSGKAYFEEKRKYIKRREKIKELHKPTEKYLARAFKDYEEDLRRSGEIIFVTG